MALGFLKKVFSFGKKEVVAEPPVEEKLAPLNFDALEQPSSPLAGEVPAERAEGVARSSSTTSASPTVEVETPPPVTPDDVAAPEEAPSAAETTPSDPSGHLPREGGEEVAPQPLSGIEPEPEPQLPEPTPEIPKPAPQEVPVSEPAKPVEIPQEPGTPAPVPEIPAAPPPATPSPQSQPVVPEPTPVAPEPAPESPEPAPIEVPPPPRRDTNAAPAGKVTVSKRVEQKTEPIPVAPAPAPRASWFQRLRDGLSRSSRELTGNVAGLFTKRRLDEDTLQDLEDVLIRADLGLETAMRITDALSSGRYGKNVSDDEVRSVMAEEIGKVLTPVALPLELDLSHKPHVILVVGVNGTGKTTTIGKLAAKLTDGGLSVMLAAGDTFRAAAIEQLKIWGERTKSPVVSSKLGADAAGLAYDAFERAKEAGADVLIIDTAGRLQNKTELMAELEKIVRVLGKLDPDAPHTVLQTVDATTGQNALNQVEIFRNIAGVNGLVMTKLDGTARGGILVGIAAKYKLPVYFIGVGEQVEDLEPFSAGDFAKAIAGLS